MKCIRGEMSVCCRQGVWMGLMTGAGCLSRVMGPVFVSYVYTRFGTVWTFALTTAMMLVAMLWLQYVNTRLNAAVARMLQGTSSADTEKLNVPMEQIPADNTHSHISR